MGKAKKSSKPASKLPQKIAHRWKVSREKEDKEEVQWDKVEKSKENNHEKPSIAMLEEPTGRHGRHKLGGTEKRIKNKDKNMKKKAWT